MYVDGDDDAIDNVEKFPLIISGASRAGIIQQICNNSMLLQNLPSILNRCTLHGNWFSFHSQKQTHDPRWVLLVNWNVGQAESKGNVIPYPSHIDAY